MASSRSSFPNKFSFDARLAFHKESAKMWGALAAHGARKLRAESFLTHRKEWEEFIVRCMSRRARYLREADAVRFRGYQ